MKTQTMQKTVAATAIVLIALAGIEVGTAMPAARVHCHNQPQRSVAFEGGTLISAGMACEWKGRAP